MVTPWSATTSTGSAMNRQEALRIYDSGREAVIEKLLSFAADVHRLEQSIAALTRNSSNSSRPPSSDLPGMKKSKGKKKSKRNQGGQPGHKGQNRKLLPVEEMDKIYDIFPERCELCQTHFSQSRYTTRFLICRRSSRSKRSIAVTRCSVSAVTAQPFHYRSMWLNPTSALDPTPPSPIWLRFIASPAGVLLRLCNLYLASPSPPAPSAMLPGVPPMPVCRWSAPSTSMSLRP